MPSEKKASTKPCPLDNATDEQLLALSKAETKDAAIKSLENTLVRAESVLLRLCQAAEDVTKLPFVFNALIGMVSRKGNVSPRDIEDAINELARLRKDFDADQATE